MPSFTPGGDWADATLSLPKSLPAGPPVLRLDLPAWRPANVLEGSSDMRTLRILRDSLPVGSFDLSQALDTLGTDGPESLSVPITVDAEVDGIQLRLVLVHVWGQRPEGRRSPTNARGYLLIRRP